MKPANPTALTLRLYRALANAFPYEFQNAYGDELMQVAEDSIEPIWRRHGVLGLVRLLLDIALRIPVEHAAEFRADLRYGLRMLRASPGFTAVALTSLTLGIGVATAAYSEMNGFVLRDVPAVRHPDELVLLRAPVSFPDYRRLFGATSVITRNSGSIRPSHGTPRNPARTGACHSRGPSAGRRAGVNGAQGRSLRMARPRSPRGRRGRPGLTAGPVLSKKRARMETGPRSSTSRKPRLPSLAWSASVSKKLLKGSPREATRALWLLR